MDESSDLPLLPVETEASGTDLSSARSITLIIHGVGNSSNERLLKPASNGYISSELGGVSKRTFLANCPTLTGGTGVESLVIREQGGSHFVVALPWANRRTRLSAVARLTAGLLLALTVLMSVTFLFRGPLEWLEQWLRSWTHRFIAYGVITGLSFIVYSLRPNPKREFKNPSIWYLFLPPLLLLGLTFFIGFDELFWIPVALLVVVLWGMATMIVLRCVAIAPTAGWKIALLALVVSIALPSAAVVRIAKQRAMHTENLYPSPDSPFARIDLLPPLPEGAPDSLPKTSVNMRTQKPPIRESSGSAPNGGVVDTITPSGNDSQDGLADLRAQAEMIHHELSKPNVSRDVRSSPKLPNMADLVSAREFAARVVLAGICIFLSSGLMAFHWVLDFGFDVLHYGGNEKFRSSLIQATTKTIRWCHEQAPNTPIILVGHSLGSVVAAQTLASLCASESWLSRVVLVTLGSPLNYINRAFPKSVPPARKLADAICAAGARWVNLWRFSDPIGKFLDIGESGTVQDCVDKGGHMDYWSRAAVWQAVAFRALGIGEGSSERAIGGAQACVFERSLGLLVFCSILLLCACGVGLAITMTQPCIIISRKNGRSPFDETILSKVNALQAACEAKVLACSAAIKAQVRAGEENRPNSIVRRLMEELRILQANLRDEIRRLHLSVGISEAEIEAAELAEQTERLPGGAELWQREILQIRSTGDLDTQAETGLEALLSLVDPKWLRQEAQKPYRLGPSFLTEPLHIVNNIRVGIAQQGDGPQRFARMLLLCEDHLEKEWNLDFYSAAMFVPEVAILGNSLREINALGPEAARKLAALSFMPDDMVTATIYEVLVGAAGVRRGLDLRLIPEDRTSSTLGGLDA